MEKENFKESIYKETENTPEEKEKEKKFDAAIVYGEGPVVEVWKEKRGDTISYRLEGYLNTCAAGHLYKEGKIGKIIVTGGKTGLEDSPSEGEIMAQILEKEFDVLKDDIIVEDAASNTIENAVYTVDTIDENPERYKNLVSIATEHHLERTEELNKLLGINAEYLGSKEILLSSDGDPERFKSYFEEIHEKKPVYQKRAKESKRWLKGLKEIPEYWLPQAAKVKNLERFRKILKQGSIKDWLKEKFNIENPDKLSKEGLKSVREQIMKIERIMPSEEWEE